MTMSARRASATFLAIVVAMLVGGELLCRYVVPRVVDAEARRDREYRQAIKLRRDTAQSPTALILGNSLLVEGVDFGRLRERIGRRVAVESVLVEGTSYFDWYYGLRKLLADGAAPDIVVLALSPDQLIGQGHRGEYSAYRLMRTADALHAGWEMGLSNTQTADLAISSASALAGMRTSLRKRAVQAIVPGLERLLPLLTAREEPPLDAVRVGAVARERLIKLRQIAETRGVRLVLLVPPTNHSNIRAVTASIEESGRAAGVEVMVPVSPGVLSVEGFSSDGFHLSKLGAGIFTPRFADEIVRVAGGTSAL